MSATRIFFAGASGVLGLRAVRLIRDAGYEVHGTTRSASKADALERAGAIPVILDVFDQHELTTRMMSIRPLIVMHQLTDLSHPRDEAIAANARIRLEGTRNLVAAARACGAERIIAQSIAWSYADGPTPHAESDPLDVHAVGARAISVGGVVSLEEQVLHAPPLAGVVLRYGRFYGPGTGAEVPPEAPTVHVDAAAYAALLAIERADSGTFNIADDNTIVSTEKARRVLGWTPSFRIQP